MDTTKIPINMQRIRTTSLKGNKNVPGMAKTRREKIPATLAIKRLLIVSAPRPFSFTSANFATSAPIADGNNTRKKIPIY